MAPASSSILLSLGLGDRLVACDTWSAKLPGMPTGVVAFDLMAPDVERLAALECDLILVSTLTQAGTSQDPFKPLADAGARVVYIPTSDSLAGIGADVTRIASLTGREAAGATLVADFNAAVDQVAKIAATIPEAKRRTVFFEISPAPYLYSTGAGTYLDEMIRVTGARNALAAETGWVAVSAEHVVALDPDVILTNVVASEPAATPEADAAVVAEIAARPGWEGVTAVREKRVYHVDNRTSSQPTPDVVVAIGQIAKAVYPEYFK